jgi:hypothetical protein
MSRNSKSRAVAMLFLIILGLCALIFAPGPGSILLWFLSTIIVPALWGDALCRRFGKKWGMIVAFAPLWVAFLLILIGGLCLFAVGWFR